MATNESSSEPKKGQQVEDGPPYVGPITQNAFGGKGPPAICVEWNRGLTEPGEFILVWAGACRSLSPRDPGTLSWSWIHERLILPDEEPVEQEESCARPEDPTLAVKVERMLSPLAHESRVRILQALYESHKSSTELSEATGLKGGNLYHHLRDLLNSAYVCEKEPGYGLTGLGRQLLITFTCIASQVVQDRDGEGLVIGGHG